MYQAVPASLQMFDHLTLSLASIDACRNMTKDETTRKCLEQYEFLFRYKKTNQKQKQLFLLFVAFSFFEFFFLSFS